MVAMTPLITIQLLGVFYQFKLKRQSSIEPEIEMSAPEDEEIIEL